MDDAPEVLRFYRDWVADAPDELMTILIHRKAPPLPFVPEELHGVPVVMVIPCWAGKVEEGEEIIRPMKEFGKRAADVCSPKPFLTHQAMFDPSFVPGRWYYFKSADVPAMTDEIIDTTVEHSLRIASPLTSFPIWQRGGAVARVGAQLLGGARAALHERLRQFSDGGGRGQGAAGLRRGEVRPPEGAEAEVRPRQLLPHQPERAAGLMAYDEELAGRIRALIGDEPAVTEQRMFGGLAFLI